MLNNSYYELRVNVYLNNDISMKEVYDKLANFINYSFNNSQTLSCLHLQKGFKGFSWSGLYPIEKDGVYKADEIYSFTIRTHSKNHKDEFIKCLNGLCNDDFIVTEVTVKQYEYKNIDYVDCLTPMIYTKSENNMRWNHEVDNVDNLKEGIFNNLIKKYNALNDTEFQCNCKDVIKNIQLRCKCGIVVKYKGIILLGYKVRVYFQQNPISQSIANMGTVTGIGEKNSSTGMGFVKPYFTNRSRRK